MPLRHTSLHACLPVLQVEPSILVDSKQGVPSLGGLSVVDPPSLSRHVMSEPKQQQQSVAEEGLEMSEGLQRVLILDFGSQYSHLICRRCREVGVYAELRACTLSLPEIEAFDPKGVILSGGPNSVYEANSPHLSADTWKFLQEKKLPVLGICYGLQEMVTHWGGKVEPGDKREFGHAEVRVTDAKCPLFASLQSDTTKVWMSHGDKVTALPPGFVAVAQTDNAPLAGVWCAKHNLFGLQFHPEVTHTKEGHILLRNFVVDVCGCSPSWNMHDFVEKEIARIRRVVGDADVVGAVSGGVDSSVAAALVFKAIGPKFHPFLVDTGLLRHMETEEVKLRLEKHIPGLELQVVQASDLFMDELKGVAEPEQKRKIIGRLFIESFDKAVHEMKGLNPQHCFLLQGTLYPDVIESLSYKGPSHTIKTHHNVGGLPERMHMELLEPLRLLFKDEVRKLGMELGLHRDSVMRHPFPGPGLAIRIIDAVDTAKADILRAADHIFMEELHASGEYSKIGQAFCVLLPTVKSVGVMGDQRTYETVCVLRAVHTTDFMTADWYQMPYEVLARVSTRIINEVRGINRVCYDVSSKPPATIEWE